MIKQALIEKLEQLAKHYQTLATKLSQATIVQDREQFRVLSKEYAQLEPCVNAYTNYQQYQRTLQDTQSLLTEQDELLQALAKEEIKQIETHLAALEQDLLTLLLPPDPHDNNNLFLEIRAGTGGHEAAIFAGDLARLYMRYADAKHWEIEIISKSTGEQGGYKEIILRILGKGAYARFKFESGVHRVQRVPATEAQGRIHTSTCTVAVLPELAEIDDIEINPADLRIDTFRASGAGGQHVQKTDSAIRITHLPSGMVVECQDERSQHKNRARAMSLLKAKILAAEREKQQREQAATRRSLVGTGDRSERIRTYNFPQGRLTDHRIGQTWYQLPQMMEGQLDEVIDALAAAHYADLIAALAEEA